MSAPEAQDLQTFFPDPFPAPWASDWGEDGVGLWMAFTFRGVRQAFRWILPGTFLMGSPKTEPERGEDEAQHKVTLTEGFWLADTACTQALWQAVMGGEEPERLPGRPAQPGGAGELGGCAGLHRRAERPRAGFAGEAAD